MITVNVHVQKSLTDLITQIRNDIQNIPADHRRDYVRYLFESWIENQVDDYRTMLVKIVWDAVRQTPEIPDIGKPPLHNDIVAIL
jgi:hypothetical protein